jgi:hypothetical protein
MSLVNSFTPIVCPNATNGDYSASSGSGTFSATRSVVVTNGATTAALFTINPALFPTPGAKYFVTFCMAIDNFVYASAPTFQGFSIVRVSQTGAPSSAVSIPAVTATAVNSAYFFNLQTVLTRNSNAITITLSNFSGFNITAGDIEIVGMTIQEMPAPVGVITGPEA